MPDNKSKGIIQADLSLLSDRQPSFATAQVRLLAAIDECGSISAAAKQVGISYKTAWDRIDAMNNMSEQPMVVRSAGGAKGGGTSLTEYGKRIVAGFQAIQDEHQAFLRQLGHRVHSLNDVAGFMKTGTIKTSARNQFRGVVEKITPGSVNAEVVLNISRNQSLIAVITEESLQRLGLAEGTQAIALVKASWVMLSTDTDLVTSARNKLIGRVARITPGAVNSDVVIDLGEGKSLSAIVTNNSVRELGLREGEEACGIFEASTVILMVDE